LTLEEIGNIFNRHFTINFVFGLAQDADGRLLAVLDDNFALVTQDFEAVGTKQIMGAGDENAAGAIGVFGQSNDVVLNRDVTLEAKFELGSHRRRQAADPLPEIQLVWSLVDEHAAAFSTPSGTPSALIVISLRTPPGVIIQVVRRMLPISPLATISLSRW